MNCIFSHWFVRNWNEHPSTTRFNHFDAQSLENPHKFSVEEFRVLALVLHSFTLEYLLLLLSLLFDKTHLARSLFNIDCYVFVTFNIR